MVSNKHNRLPTQRTPKILDRKRDARKRPHSPFETPGRGPLAQTPVAHTS